MIAGAWRWTARRSPLAWLLATPLVTAPVSALLVFAFAQNLDASALDLPVWRNEVIPARLYYFDFWRTGLLLAAPGLLNLLVVLWFFQRNGYVRVAAGLAFAMALVRTVAVPLAFFAISQSDLITHQGDILIRMEVENAALSSLLQVNSPETALLRLLSTIWLYGAFVWGATAALWGLFNPLMDRLLPQLKPPQEREGDTPSGSWGGFLARR